MGVGEHEQPATVHGARSCRADLRLPSSEPLAAGSKVPFHRGISPLAASGWVAHENVPAGTERPRLPALRVPLSAARSSKR